MRGPLGSGRALLRRARLLIKQLGKPGVGAGRAAGGKPRRFWGASASEEAAATGAADTEVAGSRGAWSPRRGPLLLPCRLHLRGG